MAASERELGGAPGTVTVIGAGIAGSSVAYFLGRAGVQVQLIDAGEHTASHVPAALLNPVRGQAGRVDARALEGLAATWALLAELSALGFSVPCGREGVLRPVPDMKTRRKFEQHLSAELSHAWRPPAAPVRPDWHSVLFIPAGGWVDGRAFCRALQEASGAAVRRGRASFTGGQWWVEGEESFALAPGSTVIVCGGSYGASLAGDLTRTHRMGTMLLLEQSPSPVPLSFGAYFSPAAQGGTLGGTFETPSPVWQPPELPLRSLAWLLQKGAALTDLSGCGDVTGRWTGSRLSGLRTGQDPAGHWHLSGLGSKGFLLGPWLARELAQAILYGFEK